MGTLSITSELEANQAKKYLTSIASHGFEIGVGRRGVYEAHAHRGFTDVAYAPGGLEIASPSGNLSGLLHIVPPGNWFGPISFLSDFWFLKFFASPQDLCDVPDKVTDEACFPGRTVLVSDELDAHFSAHLPGQPGGPFRLQLDGGRLSLTGLAMAESLVISS